MAKFNIGDIVYCINTWGTLCEGTITGEVGEYYELEGTGRKSKVMDDLSYTYGSYGARKEDCYATKEECLAAGRAKSDATLQGYLDEIKTKDDLIAFMYSHEFHSGEYCDEEACQAVDRKLKEFALDHLVG